MHLSLAIASALLFGSYVAAMPTPPVPPPVTADPNALPIFGAGGPGTPSTPSSGSLFHGSMSPPAPHSPPWRAPISPGAYFPSDAMHDDLNRQPSVASSSHHSLSPFPGPAGLQSLQSFPQRQPSTAPSFGQGPQPLTPPGYRHPSTAPSFGQALTPPDHHRHPSAAPSFGQSLSPVPGPSTFPGSAAPGPSTHHQGYPPPPPPPALPVGHVQGHAGQHPPAGLGPGPGGPPMGHVPGGPPVPHGPAYSCNGRDGCNYGTNNRLYFENHQNARIHTPPEDRPYACETCGSRFARTHLLKAHRVKTKHLPPGH